MFELLITCTATPCAEPQRFATMEQCEAVGRALPRPIFACKPMARTTTGTTGKLVHLPVAKLDLYTVTFKWEHTGTGTHTMTPITHFSKTACEQNGKTTSALMAERKEVKSVTYTCALLP